MTDIFKHWKQNRFIVAPTGTFDGNSHMVVLTDIGHWIDNIDEMIEWCKEHNCVQQGMTISVPDDETLTLFCLTWA